MTFEEFDNYQDNLLSKCVIVKNTKGKEYANSDSRFANFNRLADQLRLTPQQIAWVYVTKHLDSIAFAIKTNKFKGLSEPFEGRIIDAIVYLTLIGGMVEEVCKEKEETPKLNVPVVDILPAKLVLNELENKSTERKIPRMVDSHDLKG